MKSRAKHVLKDTAIVLTFTAFVAVVGVFARHEFAALLGRGDPSSSAPTVEVIAESVVPLASVSDIIPDTPVPEETPPPQIVEPPPPLSIPTQLIIPALGIDQPITEYTDDMVAANGGIRPDGWFTISWWSGGGRPGATTQNSPALTTFIYGHATNRPDDKIIFDDIDLLAAGDEIQVQTDNGTFTYAVETVFMIPKSEMLTDLRTRQNSEGRLLLISCWSDPESNAGGSADHNVVAVAQQTSAPPPAE